MSRTCTYLTLAFSLLSIPAFGQFQASRVGPQGPISPAPRTDRVLVVDPAGAGDYLTIQAAVDAAPEGALVLVKPGTYAGVQIDGKGLRLESEMPGAASLEGMLRVLSLSAAQEAYVGGFSLGEGLDVTGCMGDVSLVGCVSIHNEVLVPPPAGVHFGNYPDCGVGLSRHVITSSAGVSLVDCALTGRNGIRYPVCDGSPGEHALIVEDSRVTVYGGTLIGGNGSDAPGCHGAYAGAGGDAVLARGATSRVLTCGGIREGGTGGRDLELNWSHGCPGVEFRSFDGAVGEECAIDHVTFEIAPLVQTGALPSYEITGPPGADVFIMMSPRRSWREFPASEGVLHLGSGLQLIPLGVLPPSGQLSRPFPSPVPAWHRAYASIELQVYARVGALERYSEPRSLVVTSPGL